MGKKIIGGWRNYESRIYGILHIFILLLSVFLIITISIDTFRNISFLNQGNYMEIQLWICSFFMFDFWLVNPLVNGYGDALWWAFMDVTTVGSNIYAVTATGKILSVVLAALGMMMFPIFTVYVTSLLQKFNAQDKETQKP